jgi:zinc protease
VYTDFIPSSALDLAFDLEGDRIRDLALDSKIVESERGVVYSERRTSLDNNNGRLLGEQLRAAAYTAHPYQWEVVGWPSDIEGWTGEDLRAYFSMGYAPNNCVLVAVGDTSLAQITALGKKYLESIPRRDPPPPVRTKEPEQKGERRVMVSKSAQQPLFRAAFHIPEARHADIAALDVLSAVLSSGQSSRLYSRLADRDQLVLSANANAESNLDPGLFTISMQIRPGGDVARAEAVLWEEVERVRSTPVSDKELQRAKNQLLTSHYQQMKSIASRADGIGTYEVIFGDYRKFFAADKELGAVTAADVQRVARTYLTVKNRTVGILKPEAAK